jgi:hypothetical protein
LDAIVLSGLLRDKKIYVEATHMKMRTIKLTPKFLMDAIQGKPCAYVSNLPSDVELLDVRYDLFSGQIQAIVISKSFEDLVDAYPIHEFNIVYSEAKKASGPPTAPTQKTSPSPSIPSTKTESKPTATVQIEPATLKRTQIQKKPNTSLMEEEFSAEQRRLLSFSFDGDFLVIKPVKFLKTEWDDINEVVRSLGGRWVKGDIISYWEVPLEQK